MTEQLQVGAGVRIAVVDSGWDCNRPNAHIQHGINFVAAEDELAVGESADYHDENGHGTMCIDIIQRVAPAVEILPVRVFGRNLETSIETINAGIEWAIQQKVDIINLSLGTLREDALHPLYITCERARRQDIIVVAATRNSGSWSYPAVFENTIGVDLGQFESPYTYHYLPDAAVECVAKGNHTLPEIHDGKLVDVSATSFAAPTVSALIAHYRQRCPNASLEAVRAFLSKNRANHNMNYALHSR